MTPSGVLRICVVLEWAFAGLGLALSLLLESSLPDPLRHWLATQAQWDIGFLEVILLVVMITTVLCALVGSVGLLLLKRWGAWLYLASLIIAYVVLPLLGPSVEHAITETVADIATLLSGLILGLAFFSDALRAHNAEPLRRANRRQPSRSL
jgi:hypothetical protein